MFVGSAMFGEGACRVGDFPCLRILLSVSPDTQRVLGARRPVVNLNKRSGGGGDSVTRCARHYSTLREKKKKEKEKRRPFVRCALRTVITLARVHARRADQ